MYEIQRMSAAGALAIFAAAWSGGCTAADPAEPGDGITSIRTVQIARVMDYDNDGDAGDIRVQLVRPGSGAGIEEVRVFVAKSGVAGALDPGALAALGADRYAAVPYGRADEPLDLPVGLRDTDGDPVGPGIPYRVIALTVASAESGADSRMSRSARPLELAVTNLVRTITTPINAGTGGMDVDADGMIYFADFGATLSGPPGRVVYRITPEGEVSTFATGFVGASGNNFGSGGDLFQSNIAGNTVSRVTPGGTVSEFASQGLSSPVGIAIDGGDTLYVANCNDHTVQKIAPDGTSNLFSASPLLRCPNGITLADDGNLYVANFNNGNVIRLTPDGTASIFATLPGDNNGHILFGNGVLYIVDRGGHRIYEASLDGDVRVLAGSGTRGLWDGAALDAALSLTNDVALSPDGRVLYFNDVGQLSGPVSRISPTVIRALILEEDIDP